MFINKGKPKRNEKFDSTSVEGIIVGFEKGNGYRIFCLKNIIIESRRDVKFFEECDTQPDLCIAQNLIQFDKTASEPIFDNMSCKYRDEEDVLEQKGGDAYLDFHPETVTENNENDEDTPKDDTYSPNLRCTTRYTAGNPPERFACEQILIVVDPNKTRERLSNRYEEAVCGPDS